MLETEILRKLSVMIVKDDELNSQRHLLQAYKCLRSNM